MPHLSTRDLAYTALFAALISIGALISIPVGTVPFTLQVLFVLVAGLYLGPWLGALSVCVYLLVGLVAPVYANSASGYGTLSGPLGGYLWGFVLAAWLVGWLRQRLNTESLFVTVPMALAGLLPIYALGTVWLAAQLHMGWWAAISAGVTPFVLFDCLKALIAALAIRALATLPLGLRAPLRPR